MISIRIKQKNTPLSNGLYPIVLQIIKNRKRKLISLDLYVNDGEFKNNQFSRKVSNHSVKNQLISKQLSRAYEIVDELRIEKGDFTLEEFDNRFRGRATNRESVLEFFDVIIDENKRSGKISTAMAYKDSKLTLFKFAKENIQFSEINPDFLIRFEISMRERGNKNGSIAFRMRQLRALFNKAIIRGMAKKKDYPFSLYKISKLKLENNKRALSIEEFKQLLDLDITLYPNLKFSLDLFLFSFYTMGMNYVDVMELKWSNINNVVLSYTRSKTKRKIVQKLLPPALDILKHYRSLPSQTEYIFPILLKHNLTPQQKANRKHKMMRKYNTDLSTIAYLANINSRLTSYVARHSYATILKHKGVPIDVISQALGHSNTKITEVYLKSFENEVIDEANKNLLNL